MPEVEESLDLPNKGEPSEDRSPESALGAIDDRLCGIESRTRDLYSQPPENQGDQWGEETKELFAEKRSLWRQREVILQNNPKIAMDLYKKAWKRFYEQETANGRSAEDLFERGIFLDGKINHPTGKDYDQVELVAANFNDAYFDADLLRSLTDEALNEFKNGYNRNEQRSMDQERSSSPDELLEGYLSYQDAPLPEDARQGMLATNTSSANAQTYARSLQDIFSTSPSIEVETKAQDIHNQTLTFLTSIGIAPSPYGLSKTWVFWDMAKQHHYALERGTNDADLDVNEYYIADWTDERKQQEIIDRHIGWEVYLAHQQGRTGHLASSYTPEVWSNIEAYLQLPPKDNGTLRSKDLADLGTLIRTTAGNIQL